MNRSKTGFDIAREEYIKAENKVFKYSYEDMSGSCVVLDVKYDQRVDIKNMFYVILDIDRGGIFYDMNSSKLKLNETDDIYGVDYYILKYTNYDKKQSYDSILN